MFISDQPREPTSQPSGRAVRYLRVAQAIRVCVVWTLLAVTLGFILYVHDALEDQLTASTYVWVCIGVYAPLVAWFAGVLPKLIVRYQRYEVIADALFAQEGFFTRSRVVVPFERIQFVASRSGPIERRFGLTTVSLQTSARAVTVSLLDEEVADQLRDQVAEKLRGSKHDV